jgi:branched-chain amino acid transport system permease protein
MSRLIWTIVPFAIAALLPAIGSRFYIFVGTDVVIMALFALSLNLLLGYTGLVSFGHAAFFGIGAYTCAILMKAHAIPFFIALPASMIASGFIALVIGYLCVRLTNIYFSMLTLAFAQMIWALCFKWNDVTGGEQGISNTPYPDLSSFAVLPVLRNLRPAEQFYLIVLVIIAVCFVILRRIIDSPFGRILTVIRENSERAEFIGINVRAYQLGAFVLAGIFGGLAGALFGIFNRGVFPEFLEWTRSAEALIMILLGGIGNFWGAPIGALALLILKQQVTSYTEYWSFFLGATLLILLFAFPSGLVGTISEGLSMMGQRCLQRWRAH